MPKPTIIKLRTQRKMLSQQLDAVEKTARELHDQIEEIDAQIANQTYNCSCVELNEKLGIFNMVDQEKQGRKGLGIGLVYKTLSADKNCLICHGSGKPPQAEKEKDNEQSTS